MSNPWLKKNPWLSLWMSGANAMLGSARGRATAEARRQAAAMTNRAIDETVRFWTGFWTGAMTAPPKKTSRRKRSR